MVDFLAVHLGLSGRLPLREGFSLAWLAISETEHIVIISTYFCALALSKRARTTTRKRRSMFMSISAQGSHQVELYGTREYLWET
jgi:hypothetical protein